MRVNINKSEFVVFFFVTFFSPFLFRWMKYLRNNTWNKKVHDKIKLGSWLPQGTKIHFHFVHTEWMKLTARKILLPAARIAQISFKWAESSFWNVLTIIRVTFLYAFTTSDLVVFINVRVNLKLLLLHWISLSRYAVAILWTKNMIRSIRRCRHKY